MFHFLIRRCPWKCLYKWGSSCIWTLLARMLICCCAPARPKMRLDQVGCINQSFWLCECGWFESFRYLLLTSVVFSTSSSTASCVEHGPPWLAATGAIRWHMSRSPATTCRRFDAAGLSDPWFEGNEVVWMVLNESTWRWWEKICLWNFVEFELGMPLVAVCRCLFYFTVQWFLYYQDDLPISSLSNIYDNASNFSITCWQVYRGGQNSQWKLCLLLWCVQSAFLPSTYRYQGGDGWNDCRLCLLKMVHKWAWF